MAARKKEKPSIILPGQTELDSKIGEILPHKAEKKVIYGPDGGVLASSLGKGWVLESDAKKWRAPASYERVVAVGDVADVKAKAREVQGRLFRDYVKSTMSLWSVMDDTLKVPLYLDEHKGGFPPEHRDFCRRYGFDSHLYPIAKGFVGADEGTYPKRISSLMEDCGFTDVASVGKFMSLAYPSSKDIKVVDSTHRFFFAIMAPTLMEALKEGGEADKAIGNVGLILGQTSVKARAGLYVLLGEHPNALRQLVGFNWLEAGKIGGFFRRLIDDPSSFDGLR